MNLSNIDPTEKLKQMSSFNSLKLTGNSTTPFAGANINTSQLNPYLQTELVNANATTTNAFELAAMLQKLNNNSQANSLHQTNSLPDISTLLKSLGTTTLPNLPNLQSNSLPDLSSIFKGFEQQAASKNIDLSSILKSSCISYPNIPAPTTQGPTSSSSSPNPFCNPNPSCGISNPYNLPTTNSCPPNPYGFQPSQNSGFINCGSTVNSILNPVDALKFSAKTTPTYPQPCDNLQILGNDHHKQILIYLILSCFLNNFFPDNILDILKSEHGSQIMIHILDKVKNDGSLLERVLSVYNNLDKVENKVAQAPNLLGNLLKKNTVTGFQHKFKILLDFKKIKNYCDQLELNWVKVITYYLYQALNSKLESDGNHLPYCQNSLQCKFSKFLASTCECLNGNLPIILTQNGVKESLLPKKNMNIDDFCNKFQPNTTDDTGKYSVSVVYNEDSDHMTCLDDCPGCQQTLPTLVRICLQQRNDLLKIKFMINYEKLALGQTVFEYFIELINEKINE